MTMTESSPAASVGRHRRSDGAELVFPFVRSAELAVGELAAVPVAQEDGERPIEDGRGRSRDLFGRGMLYVLIWSMQVVVATVVSPVLAYALGPSEFGSLASAIALYQVLITVALFGVDQALELQRVEDKTATAARGLLTVGILMAVVVTAIAAATAPLWAPALGFPSSGGLVMVTLLWTAPGAAVLMVLSLLQSEDRLGLFAFISCLSTVGGQLFGIALMMLLGRSAIVYAWGGVISQGLAVVIGLIVAKPRIHGLVEFPIIQKALKLGTPLMLSGLSVFVLNAGDRFIIQRLLGSSEVGRYQVAFTIGYVMVLILSFTNRAWIPRLATITDNHERWAVIRESRDGIYRLLVPAVLGITLAAPLVLRVVAPASFQPGSLLIVVFLVAVSAFPVTASGASGRLFITLRKSRPLAISSAVAAVLMVGLDFVLIPWLGLAGAGIATILAFGAQVWVQTRSLPGDLAPERPPVKLILMCVAACAVAGGTIALPQTPVWNIGRVVVGLACLPWFISALRAARGGSDDDAEGDAMATSIGSPSVA